MLLIRPEKSITAYMYTMSMELSYIRVNLIIIVGFEALYGEVSLYIWSPKFPKNLLHGSRIARQVLKYIICTASR